MGEALTRRENEVRMAPGMKRLLHEDIGMGWRDCDNNEDEVRAVWLTSAHARQGLQNFLSRKGRRA
jgi:hypothetical protein